MEHRKPAKEEFPLLFCAPDHRVDRAVFETAAAVKAMLLTDLKRLSRDNAVLGAMGGTGSAADTGVHERTPPFFGFRELLPRLKNVDRNVFSLCDLYFTCFFRTYKYAQFCALVTFR